MGMLERFKVKETYEAAIKRMKELEAENKALKQENEELKRKISK